MMLIQLFTIKHNRNEPNYTSKTKIKNNSHRLVDELILKKNTNSGCGLDSLAQDWYSGGLF
jgi:hypothetical protein